MSGIILINIVESHSQVDKIGLHRKFVNGDYRYLDGMKLQETKLTDKRYFELSNLIYRTSEPGEPLHMLAKDVHKVGKFLGISLSFDYIIHV